MDMGTGCLRWLLALIPLGLLTALGLGFLNDEFEPQPLPPVIATPTSVFDFGYSYYTTDGSVVFPILPAWSTSEGTSGFVFVTNAANPDQVFLNQSLQSGEFQITIETPAALQRFGIDATQGPQGVIDFFRQMQSPDAVYSEPIAISIGGREALRVDIINASISREISFYAFAVTADRTMVVATETLSGESYLVNDLVIQFMERTLYLGDPLFGLVTPTYPPDFFPTPFPTTTLIPYTPYGFAPEEYQMTIEAMYGTLAAQSAQLNTLMPQPTMPPTPTQTGAFVVQIAGVEGVGDYQSEAVVLEINAGVDLEGWTILGHRAESGTYVFHPLTPFEAGDVVRLYTQTGVDNQADFYWGLDEANWLVGDTIYIYDSAARLMDTYLIPAE